MPPILYSFRRCPYAIRARMTILYAAQTVELREVFLQEKPRAMLEASPKGTVPVLVLADGTVIDESVDIMHWALAQNDPDSWWCEKSTPEIQALVEENDFEFKTLLDRYKYADRYPQKPQSDYRAGAEKFLQQLEHCLERRRCLIRDQLSFADVAVFPFVRQFASVDKAWFDQAPYPKLQTWLQSMLDSSLFLNAMRKLPAWREGDTKVVFR